MTKYKNHVTCSVARFDLCGVSFVLLSFLKLVTLIMSKIHGEEQIKVQIWTFNLAPNSRCVAVFTEFGLDAAANRNECTKNQRHVDRCSASGQRFRRSFPCERSTRCRPRWHGCVWRKRVQGELSRRSVGEILMKLVPFTDHDLKESEKAASSSEISAKQ